MEYSLPGSFVHGILHERILEWVAISFSRGTSWPRDRAWISCIAFRFFTIQDTREALIWSNTNLTHKVMIWKKKKKNSKTIPQNGGWFLSKQILKPQIVTFLCVCLFMKFAYLPSLSPRSPPKNDAIIPPTAKLDTDRDQNMVMRLADVIVSSSVQETGVGFPGLVGNSSVLLRA